MQARVAPYSVTSRPTNTEAKVHRRAEGKGCALRAGAAPFVVIQNLDDPREHGTDLEGRLRSASQRRTRRVMVALCALLSWSGVTACGSAPTASSESDPVPAPGTSGLPSGTVAVSATAATPSTSSVPPKAVAPKPGRVLVVGDSVAFSVAASVLAASPNGSALGISELTSKAVIACTLARWATKARAVDGKVSDVPVCTTWPQMWQPELATHPDTSLLIIGNPGAQELLSPDGQWVRPCDAGYSDRYRVDLRDAMAMLKASSGRVAVTTAGYWRPPPSRALPGVDYKSFDPHTDCLNKVIREVAAEAGVPVLDMGAWICPSPDSCRLTEGSVMLRPDGIHYDGPGGPIAMQWLLSQLPD